MRCSLGHHGVRVFACVVVAIAATGVGRDAAAQLAPTGDHYAGRSTDTGFSGKVNAAGGYATAVPLELPTARGGLPVPVAVTFGGHSLGAAGVGWDVPLSYVHVDTSITKRKPRNVPNQVAAARQRVSLSLAGESLTFVQKAGTSTWLSQQDATLYTATSTGAKWIVQDGAGHTYTFAEPANHAGIGFFLLNEVDGPGGMLVTLGYDVKTVALTGGNAISIDLTSVSYNFNPQLGCAKDTISLAYGDANPTPLSISVLPTVIVRMRTLSSISVITRANCASQTTLRRYAFAYAADPDSGLPRLQNVVMFGRDGTSEASTPLPVAAYTYGSASAGGALTFTQTSTVAMPQTPGLDSTHFGTSGEALLSLFGVGQAYSTPQTLTDLTGDGRPDVVYTSSNTLWISKNAPTPTGDVALNAPTVLGDTALTISGPTSDSKRTQKRYSQGLSANKEDVWKQLIDINGDGRIDVIDASAHPGEWTVYLNTPGNGPSGVAWQERVIPIGTVRDRLSMYGHVFDDSDHLPLARHYTAREYWTNSAGDVDRTGAEYTYTEWELKDINGDGLPDFVFDTLPVRMQEIPSGSDVDHVPIPGPAANSIEAMFDVTAVTLDPQGTSPAREVFSSPAVLIENTACGIELWLEDIDHISINGTEQYLRCTLADVTGDGIVDRVDHAIAYPGLGSGFSHIQIPLQKDFAGQHWSGQPVQCPGQSGSATFQSFIVGGLHDVNGDGIADLIVQRADLSGIDAFVGTGFGFRSTPLTINGMGNLSTQYERCDGASSVTSGGLFDIDGDGRPESVSLDPTGTMTVRTLAGGSAPGVPEAGEITSVDNGYGGTVEITYQSAKQDGTTAHSVPFPEIVVASVQTHRAGETASDTLAATRYAYGGASLAYDPRAAVFVFTGYRRVVSLRTYGTTDAKATGQATITDTLGLDQYTGGTHEQRFARNAVVGRPSATTVLSGTLGVNPWALLALDPATDNRQTARTTYTLASKLTEEAVSGDVIYDCSDYPDPYDFEGSLSQAVLGYDTCSAHGFTYTSNTVANRGAPGSTASVQTRTRVVAVDGYGRATQIAYDNDVYRTDDDLCVDTTYPTPTGNAAPILIVPATQRLWGCTKGAPTYRYDQYEYDTLPIGQVGAGRETSHTLERHATDTGAVVNSFRVFDGTYNALGDLVHTITVRDDGDYRETAYTYDPFGLVVVRTDTSGTNLPTLTTLTSVDPYTLDPNTVTDPNGTQRIVSYDGFQRITTTSVVAPGGITGVLSKTTYTGFAGGTAPRQIATTVFDDPVLPSQLGTAVGHTKTAFLDELGREVREETNLGSDYSNQIVVTGYRTYDVLGRVAFAADPYVSTTNPSSAYGTSYYYHDDGTPNCFVRATGPHALTAVSDSATETFPECFYHGYSNYLETFGTSAADANLPSSPQYGTLRMQTMTAAGRVLSRSTSRSGTVLEYSTYSQDRLGNTITETRFKVPASATYPVTTRWRYDSDGDVLSQQDPEGPLTSYVYDDWDEPTQIVWSDNTTNPATDRRITSNYDAYGRLVHRDERNAGLIDDATVNDYIYDTGGQVSPEVKPTNLLGRLAQAVSPTSTTYFSYDVYGAPNATTWFASDGTRYVQTFAHRKDGTLLSSDFYLPDNSYKDEHVDYAYDTAHQLRNAKYVNAGVSTTLYDVGSYDPFGRMLGAKFAATTYNATYNATGRRLLRDAKISTSIGASREFVFDAYDPVGREMGRHEKNVGLPNKDYTHTYDALGRLIADKTVTNGTTTTNNWSYGYDPIGNLTSASDSISGSSTVLSYRTIDEDEACKLGYPTPTGTGCNVVHDYFGNVISMPSRTGTRTLDYFLSGQVRRVADVGSNVTFGYDAFGGLQDLLVQGSPTDSRHQQRYGNSIEVFSSSSVSYTSRSLPGPGGVVVSLRGPGAAPLYAFSDAHGVRFTTDNRGRFLQDMTYQPFGNETSTGQQPGGSLYTTEQWNSGDALASLGLSILGARLYDPQIGRFLSRDPIHIARTSATTNPYAFAINDPVNFTDPSGRDWQDGCIGIECQGLQWQNPFDLFGGGGGTGSHSPGPGYGGTPSPPPPPGAPPMTGKTDGACEFPDGAGGCNESMWPTFRSPPWYVRAGSVIQSGANAFGHGWMYTMSHIDRGLHAAAGFVGDHMNYIAAGTAFAIVAFTQPEVAIADLWTNGTTALAALFTSDEPAIVDGVSADVATVDGAAADGAAADGATANGATANTAPNYQRPPTPYSRAQFGGAKATNNPVANALREANEGVPCPTCTKLQISGTPNAPSPEHDPPLVEVYYEHGGGNWTQAEREAYASSPAAFNGTQCLTCQRQQGGELSAYSKFWKLFWGY